MNKNSMNGLLLVGIMVVGVLAMPSVSAVVTGFNENFDTTSTGPFAAIHSGYTFSSNAGDYNVTAPGLSASTNALYMPDTATPGVKAAGIVTLNSSATPTFISFDLQVLGTNVNSQTNIEFTDSRSWTPDSSFVGAGFGVEVFNSAGVNKLGYQLASTGCGSQDSPPLVTVGTTSHKINMTVNWSTHAVTMTVDNANSQSGFFWNCTVNSLSQIAFTDGQNSPAQPAGNYILDSFTTTGSPDGADVTSNFNTNFAPNKLEVSNEYNPSIYIQDRKLNNSNGQSNNIFKTDKTLALTSMVAYCNLFTTSFIHGSGQVYSANDTAEISIGNQGTSQNQIYAPCKNINESDGSSPHKYNDIGGVLSSQLTLIDSGIGGETGLTSSGISDASDNTHVCFVVQDTTLNSNVPTLRYASFGGSSGFNIINAPFAGLSSCYVDKTNNDLIASTSAGITLYGPTGTALGSSALSSGGRSVAHGTKAYDISSNTLRRYALSSGALVANSNTSVTSQNNIYISPDGKYIFTWSDTNSNVVLYATTNMSQLKALSVPSTSTVNCRTDIANNYLFCLGSDAKAYRFDIFNFTGGINGTINPPPASTSTSTSTGSVTIPVGSGNGGYVGNPTTFFGFNISYLATQFGIDVTAVQWLLGILVVALVIYGLGASNPIIIAVAVLLGVGLAVLFGLFPVWLLLVLVFLLIAVVARMFFGGTGGDEM